MYPSGQSPLSGASIGYAMCDMWSGESRSLPFQQPGKLICARRPDWQFWSGNWLIGPALAAGSRQTKETARSATLDSLNVVLFMFPATMRRPAGNAAMVVLVGPARWR